MTEHNLAAPELAAIDVQGINRQSFIMRGAVAAGAVYGLGAVGPFVRQAIAQENGGDVDILNFALTLEYLEAAFYTQALKQVGDLRGDVKSLATEIRDNENEHVAALEMTIKDLGGRPVKAPGVDFGYAFANQKAFLELAQTFEDTGVSAYTVPPRRSSRRTSSPPPGASCRSRRGTRRRSAFCAAGRSPTAALTSRSRCRPCSTRSSRS
jgi:hypothetical protein